MAAIIRLWKPDEMTCKYCFCIFKWYLDDLRMHEDCYWVTCPNCKSEETIPPNQLPQQYKDRAEHV